jgi:hypothetical protein
MSAISISNIKDLAGNTSCLCSSSYGFTHRQHQQSAPLAERRIGNRQQFDHRAAPSGQAAAGEPTGGRANTIN